MISLGLLVLLQISVTVFGAGNPPNNGPHSQPPHHPTVTTVPGSGEVDAAIVNINTHYNDALCLELLLVDCATHVTKGDEQVCGSNGVTYDNHCHFTHALCETLHFDMHKITLQSHGACPNTTAPPSTVASVTTAASGSVTTAVTHGASSGHITDATTTSSPAPTSTMAPTTTDPIGAIVQNVFCSNLASISCAGGFDVICGTDGNYYPNQCEFSKAKCHDNTLTISSDTTNCQASVVVVMGASAPSTHQPHATHEPHATRHPQTTEPIHHQHLHNETTHKPSHPEQTPDSGEVDAAIVYINSHYNDELCLELLLVDCATHVTKGDEQVCSSNWVTYDNQNVASITCPSELKVICGSDSQFYPNMCKFTKERCKNRTLSISTDPNRC